MSFAVKTSMQSVLSCTSEDSKATGLKARSYKLAGGISCDRVWIQGTVLRVVQKTSSFWISDGLHRVRVSTKQIGSELPQLNEYVSVIGKLIVMNEGELGAAEPAQSSASNANSIWSNASSDGSESGRQALQSTPKTGMQRSICILAHKLLVLAEPERRKQLWERELAYLDSVVYPMLVANQNLQRLRHGTSPGPSVQLGSVQTQAQSVCGITVDRSNAQVVQGLLASVMKEPVHVDEDVVMHKSHQQSYEQQHASAAEQHATEANRITHPDVGNADVMMVSTNKEVVVINDDQDQDVWTLLDVP